MISISKRQQSFQYYYMNTNIQSTLLSSSTDYKKLDNVINDYYQMIEAKFSRFNKESELSYVNLHAGELTEVSQLMLEVLILSEAYRKLTNNLFNIFISKALLDLGYTESFEMIKHSFQKTDIPESDLVDIESPIEILANHSKVLLNPFVKMDLGGIVKGWATQKLSHTLKEQWNIERGFVNAGGDMALWGGSSASEPWVVGIENPWIPEEDIGVIVVNNGTIATSSTLGRRWRTSQGEMHHIIDPRSMKPSISDVIQCTVLGDDLSECEVWAKILCILDKDDSLKLIQNLKPSIEALIFTSDYAKHFIGYKRSLYNTWEVDVDFVYDFFNRN